MALQQGVGLLPERDTRLSTPHRAYPFAIGLRLKEVMRATAEED